MAYTAVTYSFTNSTTADATQVNQNYTDIVNGLSDGTKDLNVNAITAAGTVTLNGPLNVGNSSSDDLTITSSLASSIPIKTTNSYDIGSSTLGLRAAYFGANSQSVKVQGSSTMSATWTFTFPVTAGTSGYYLKTDGSGVTSWQAFTVCTVQNFTSGSGTYTTPANVKYLRVIISAGGAGGSGSGLTTALGGAGGIGGDSYIRVAGGGAKILDASGGPATGTTGAGGAGGVATINSPAYGIAIRGGEGGSYSVTVLSTIYIPGGHGGQNALGGSCSSGAGGSAVGSPAANSGAGGAGGGGGGVINNSLGIGGGAGAYIDAIIPSPSATYDYLVGAGGAAGTAGTSGYVGAAGAAGRITVFEYYS